MKPGWRRMWVLVAFGSMLGAIGQVRAAAEQRPNIIFILADDLGYGDLGAYGQKLIRTPRLDQLAREGMRFTQFYAGAPTCAPSRCVLMTGKHTGHSRIRANSDKSLLPEDEVFTQVLKSSGYATGAVGKWGLGLDRSPGAPWLKGVDEFLGYLNQTHAHTHYPDYLWKNDRKIDIPENRDGARKVYSHDLFANEALDFIKRHKDQPFFLYGAFTLPHAEVSVPDDSLAEYRGKWPEPKPFAGAKTYMAQKEPRAVRAAMITRFDRDVGRIMDLLDELKIADRTLVIFASDNGPITAGGQDPEFFDSNGPLRDLKFTLYEGGIRVPFIARWKGKIAAGKDSAHIGDFADMFPTFAELAGAKAPGELDGVSIVPTLLGQPANKQAKREYLYWEAAPQQAVRMGDWKLFRATPEKAAELYNLADDIGETKNVAVAQPEMARRLEALLKTARVESEDFPLEKAERKKNKK